MKCLDTYALIEIHDANPSFLPYLEKEFIIPETTMAEFYGVILREYNEQTANYILKKFESYLRPVDIELLIKAVKFRHENKKLNLSFFDCVGYMFALENKVKFVTGDKEFENMPNVEFKKKKL